MNDLVTAISGVAAAMSAVIAIIAIVYSRAAVRATREQATAAHAANVVARHAGQSEAIIHFTSRYHQLMTSGGPHFEDPGWAYQMWGLHATEYYFFEQGWIPNFMFELWTVELVLMYEDDTVRQSHLTYLQNFSDNYGPMCDFYERVRAIAENHAREAMLRNRAVATLIADWPRQGAA